MRRIIRDGFLKIGWFLRWYIWTPVARVIGRARPARQIKDIWPAGDITLGARIVLFMHFDGRGNVRRQLFDYMRDLRDNGRCIVFVSNAGRINDAAMAELKEICAGIIIRKNIGYDFGAWRDAIEYLGLPRAETEELILANDSVFGPLIPLGDTLRKLNYAKADIWGLTESWQLRYHLQSFFLAFGPTALRAPAFAKFWKSVRPVPSKPYVVHAYEVGVTQEMLKGGLSCAALWGYEALIRLVNREELEKLILAEESELGKSDPIQVTRKLQILRIRDGVARRLPLNPTSDLWRQLLLSGFPFIKRELLRDNPTKVQDLGDWVEVVRELLAADPDPILLDLRTMLKGSAP
jgi:hypothetical protein